MSLASGWILLCAAAFVSALLTAATRYYALRRNLLDAPGRRRSHALPTPRGGGLGPILTILVAGVCWLVITHRLDKSIATCLAGLSLVAVIGWWDDHRPLPASLRLTIHLAAAALAALGLLGMPSTPAQSGLLLIAIIWIAGLINAWNFMDGIDGIATTQAIMVTACVLIGGALFAWLDARWMAAGWVAIGALLGFLPFNFPRARIFLGDVGSGALGFMIACLLLRAIVSGGMRWPLAMLAVSAFGIDAALTLGKRMAQRKAWWRPHREHLYQWMVRRGKSHQWVNLAYATWTLLACVMTLIAAPAGAVLSAWMTIAALSCACLLWLGARRRLGGRTRT
ncbi:MAG: glycosyltransferase family 4 protein [Lysobacteraceae bacterium]